MGQAAGAPPWAPPATLALRIPLHLWVSSRGILMWGAPVVTAHWSPLDLFLTAPTLCPTACTPTEPQGIVGPAKGSDGGLQLYGEGKYCSWYSKL